jgi:uncharacterized repeat protein (TIGR03803 family)
MNKKVKAIMVIFVFCLAATIVSFAQTFSTLFSFNETKGRTPSGSLIQGTDGNFYGTAENGGTSSKYCPFSDGCGTIFKATADGQVTTVYSFCREAQCADGDLPNGALVQGTNGSFYGAAAFGGTSTYSPCTYGCGVIFEITSGGRLKTLYNFCAQNNCADGGLPNGSLVLGTNGNLYGTTEVGGANCFEGLDGKGCGTVFEITPTGKLTTLYSFCSQVNGSGGCVDGMSSTSGLVLAANGNFYGTTSSAEPGPTALVLTVARFSKSRPRASWLRCTASARRQNARMDTSPPPGWCRPAMESFTGQRATLDLLSAARLLRLPLRAN